MLQNAPTLAIVAVDTEENEPSRVQVKNNEITCTHYLIPRCVCFRKICYITKNKRMKQSQRTPKLVFRTRMGRGKIPSVLSGERAEAS